MTDEAARIADELERCSKQIICPKDKLFGPAAKMIRELHKFREIAVGAVILAGPCQADHHGLCQAHNLQPLDDCWVARFRKLLARDRNFDEPAPKFNDGMNEEQV